MGKDTGAPKRDCFAYRSCNGRQWCDCLNALYCLHENCKYYKPQKKYDEEYKKYGWKRSDVEEFNYRHRVDGKLINVLLETKGYTDMHKVAEECGISYRSIYDALHKNTASNLTIQRLTELLDIPEDAIKIR